MKRYPRDFYGYGKKIPKIIWPSNSKIAVQFVLNYEEGGENCILHGDNSSESFLSEIIGAVPWKNQRHWNMESIYEYGARSGFWRIYNLFQKNNIPITVFGVATALKRSPEQVKAMIDANWEIASHGLKWIDYRDFSKKEELKHIEEAINIHKNVTGRKPSGWDTGRRSINTVDLITKLNIFKYTSDSYADDLPYWHYINGDSQLIIPYSLDVNDMRFVSPQGFNSGEQFYDYLKDSFDVLYNEGNEGYAKILSIGLHCRIIGRPGRLNSLKKFIDYIKSHDKVWITRRIDIADFWHKNYPFNKENYIQKPCFLNKDNFVKKFGNIFEESKWVAEETFDKELSFANNNVTGLHHIMCDTFRNARYNKKLSVLNSHPDLAGKLQEKNLLTEESNHEQKSAGLNSLSEKEKKKFYYLNNNYKEKFGFPFILAVKNMNKTDILNFFQTRLENSKNEEFEEACRQVEKIALLRLEEKFLESNE